MTKQAHQLANQTSGVHEFYTPDIILGAMRRVIGRPALDVSSCEEANVRVRARRFYTRGDDAMSKAWAATSVWMNHPWGARELPCKNGCKKVICTRRGHHRETVFPGNGAWINKLIGHYERGDIKRAMCITYASTSEQWFKPLMAYPQCYLYGRTSFHAPGGRLMEQNPKGCVVTYLGDDLRAFQENFGVLGGVMLPWRLYK